MKIAIIGAGLSGLACAVECERLGVIPHVFEKDDAIGWPWVTASIWPALMYKDYGDVIEYLKKTYNIILKPAAKITKNILKSPNKEVILNGNLGYYVYRGRKTDSIENQLYRYLKSTAVYMDTPAIKSLQRNTIGLLLPLEVKKKQGNWVFGKIKAERVQQGLSLRVNLSRILQLFI